MTSVFSVLTSNSLPHSRLNFHGDELHPLGGAELGGELRAEAVSHLEEVSELLSLSPLLIIPLL